MSEERGFWEKLPHWGAEPQDRRAHQSEPEVRIHFIFDFLLFCIVLCFVFSVLLPALIPVTSCPVLTIMSNKIVTGGCLCLCRYVEQNNLRMEQRNDSLKNSSEQNQARILQAEQDKVTLFNSPIHHTHNNTRAALFQNSVSCHALYCLHELMTTSGAWSEVLFLGSIFTWHTVSAPQVKRTGNSTPSMF